MKKVFKTVGGLIKRYWKPILMAAAIYFTAGIALAYFAPTAGFAAAMPGFGAGGMFSGAATWMGIGSAANVAGGTGLFGLAGGGAAAATLGAGAAAVGAGELAPGAAVAADLTSAAGAADLGGAGVMAAGTSAADLTAATGTAIGAGASEFAAAAPSIGSGIGSTAAKVGSSVADKGFWGGMSGGEKAQLAATAFQGLSGLLKPGPTKKELGLWPGGAYFGDKDTDLGAMYKQGMSASADVSTGQEAGSPADQPVQQAKPGAPGAPTQSGTVGALAAGGAPEPVQGQQQGQPSPAAGAQTGSPFLSAGGAAQTAQQATAQQGSALEQTDQANNAFIQKTYADLDPTKRRTA